jgi:hypothetical protein
MKAGMLAASLAALALIAVPQSLHAQVQQRWEVTPFVGFETSGSYPIANSAAVDRVRADQNYSYGVFADWSWTDSVQFEFMWDRNPTTFDQHSPATNIYTTGYNSTVSQYQWGALYMFRSPEQKLRPYAAASIGLTHFANAAPEPTDTEISFGVGGGIKYYATRHFGFRADARYVPTFANSSPAEYCDPFGGCYTANQRNYLSRFNLTAGLVVRF